MDKTYIGIDPGQKGFITWYDGEGYEFFALKDMNGAQIADTLKIIKESSGKVVCAMESVHSIFGSSAKSTFSFGEIFGFLKGVLNTLRIPYHLVTPKVWQKEIWIHDDIVYDGKKVNTKKTSFNAATRLFPGIDLRRTSRCSSLDDNKCDSLLIAEYARRKNL